MRLYTFCSPSHRPMLERYLAPSADRAGFDLHALAIEQLCPSGSYYDSGWLETMRRKVEFLTGISESHRGECVVYCDSDVLLNARNFGPETARRDLGTHYLALQDDVVQYCCGFMILRGCAELESLFAETLRALDGAGDDQTALNRVVAAGPYRVKRLPRKQYACVAQFRCTLGSDRLWNGTAFRVPRELKMFHANWTRGVEQKERLLACVERSLASEIAPNWQSRWLRGARADV